MEKNDFCKCTDVSIPNLLDNTELICTINSEDKEIFIVYKDFFSKPKVLTCSALKINYCPLCGTRL